MHKLLVIVAMCMAFCYLTAAAPAPVPAPANDPQNVQFLKYSNDQELDALQKQIIAQYEHLGGTSKFHNVQSLSYVDPKHFVINI